MSAWHIGTAVCSGCNAVLSIKATSGRITCYLCEAPIDLSELPVVEIADPVQPSDLPPEESPSQ